MALLADCVLTSRFKAGETIFREGEPADRFYLIEKGKVVLESGAGYGEPVCDADVIGWRLTRLVMDDAALACSTSRLGAIRVN